jgi:hypothetical protein
LEGQNEETKGASEDYEEVYYKEPDLSVGVEGVDYTIAYRNKKRNRGGGPTSSVG